MIDRFESPIGLGRARTILTSVWIGPYKNHKSNQK